MTGSSFPSAARAVKSTPNFSRGSSCEDEEDARLFTSGLAERWRAGRRGVTGVVVRASSLEAM